MGGLIPACAAVRCERSEGSDDPVMHEVKFRNVLHRWTPDQVQVRGQRSASHL